MSSTARNCPFNPGGVLHCEAHDVGVHYRTAVVGQSHGTRAGHFANVCKTFALLSAGDRAYRTDFAEALFLGAVYDVIYHHRIVAHGVGIGHATELGNTPGNGGAAARRYIFLALVTRFAKVDVHIDYARNDRFTRSFYYPVGRTGYAADAGNYAVFDKDVAAFYFIEQHRVGVFY